MRKHMSLLSLLAVGAIASLAMTAHAQAPADSTGRMKPVPTRPGQQPTPIPGQQPGQHKAGEYPYGNLNTSPSMKARAEMRQVWGENLAYTRNFIVSAVGNLPDVNDVSNRLLQNADDIGRVFQPYYGDDGSRKLSTLLRDQAKILSELTQVVSGDAEGTTGSVNTPGRSGTTPSRTGTTGSGTGTTGSSTGNSGYGNDRGDKGRVDTDDDATGDMNQVDKEALSGIQQRLEANARQIAMFFSRSNPNNFKQSDFEGIMQAHVGSIIDQIDARLNGDWQADIQAFDQAMDHVFNFADALSAGIERQFPDRFAQVKS